jgi:hypothetical protein
MVRKRPCRICRRWFQPHPRVKDRQRVCSSAECQRERHRRGCARWHESNAGYDRERRVRERLTAPRAEISEELQRADPLAGLAWSVARDAVGVDISVIIEESARVVVDWVRDAVPVQPGVRKAKSGGHPQGVPRDEIGGARAGP